ncbi:hypothetical protein Bca101_026865 [Brassica carinata]
MTKSLTDKLLQKQQLFVLHMHEGIEIRDHLDKLNSIFLELRKIDVKVEDEEAALSMLALHSRKLRHKASNSWTYNQAFGLFGSGVKGHENIIKKSKDKKSFSRCLKLNYICNYCKEKGHGKPDCPKKKREQQSGSTALAEDEAKSDEDIALVVHRHIHALF